jgi:glycosyltransferase involved in cell wall biosynthesis
MKITTILLTYNRPEYFLQALESYKQQKCDNTELLIVNNGSTIKYPDYKLPDDAVYLDFEKNNIDTFDVAMTYAHGDIITMLHDDDMFFDERSLYNRAKPFRENRDIEVIYTAYGLMDSNGNKDGIIHDAQNVSLKNLLQKEYIYYPTMAWRKDITQKFLTGCEHMRGYSDWIFKIRCLFECNCMPVHVPTLWYRQHSNQESSLNARNGINKEEKDRARKIVRDYIGGYL